MPILDLISQIEGGKPTSGSPAPFRNPLPLKRKADDDDVRNGSNKTPRTASSGPLASAPTRPALSRPSLPAPGERRAVITQRSLPSQPLSKPKDGPKRPSFGVGSVISGRVTKSSRATKPPSFSASAASATVTAAAAAAAAAASAVGICPGTPKPPLKGSYSEIMARAKKAQEMMGPVGRIQHKPIERAPRKDVKGEPAKGTTSRKVSGSAPPTSKRAGTVPAPGSRNSNPPHPSQNGRGGTENRTGKTGKKPAEPEKKVSKAVTATTGYTGTARPKPGAASESKNADAAVRAGLVNRQALRGAKAPGRSRYDYDEDDEELDDFIEYDDDEEPYERRRQCDYDSDGSSDMEADLDAIDYEERIADRLAKAEDKKAEEEERRARLEKDDARRRKAQEGKPSRCQ